MGTFLNDEPASILCEYPTYESSLLILDDTGDGVTPLCRGSAPLGTFLNDEPTLFFRWNSSTVASNLNSWKGSRLFNERERMTGDAQSTIKNENSAWFSYKGRSHVLAVIKPRGVKPIYITLVRRLPLFHFYFLMKD